MHLAVLGITLDFCSEVMLNAHAQMMEKAAIQQFFLPTVTHFSLPFTVNGNCL